MMPRLLSALAVAAVLAGCTTAPAPAETPEEPSPYLTVAIGADGPGTAPGPGIYPLVPATHAHVQLWCPLVPAVHYDPEAIAPTDVDKVFICTTDRYLDAPDGTPQIEEFVDRVATEDLPALLEAYAAEDEAASDGVCSLVGSDPLISWLHHGEDITPVYLPRDECGAPSDEAQAVYASLDLHRILVAREKLTP